MLIYVLLERVQVKRVTTLLGMSFLKCNFRLILVLINSEDIIGDAFEIKFSESFFPCLLMFINMICTDD